MTLRHMKIFVTVCECHSVTAAAEKLYLAQPSVSLAIRELEEYYGIQLFDRISRKMLITEAGKLLLDYAIHIVDLFDTMEKEIRNWDSMGTMRVGSSITIGNFLLIRFVKEFKEKYPHIKVNVTIQNSEEIEKRIMDNDIDFGLIEGVVHNKHIVSEKFMEDELVFVCGKGHALAESKSMQASKLSEWDFILRERGSGGRELFESALLTHNIEITPIWESVSTQAIIKAVIEGLGLSVLPFELVKEELGNGNLIRLQIEEISLRRYFYIIYHKNKLLSHSAKEFINLCKKDSNNRKV